MKIIQIQFSDKFNFYHVEKMKVGALKRFQIRIKFGRKPNTAALKKMIFEVKLSQTKLNFE